MKKIFTLVALTLAVMIFAAMGPALREMVWAADMVEVTVGITVESRSGGAVSIESTDFAGLGDTVRITVSVNDKAANPSFLLDMSTSTVAGAVPTWDAYIADSFVWSGTITLSSEMMLENDTALLFDLKCADPAVDVVASPASTNLTFLDYVEVTSILWEVENGPYPFETGKIGLGDTLTVSFTANKDVKIVEWKINERGGILPADASYGRTHSLTSELRGDEDTVVKQPKVTVVLLDEKNVRFSFTASNSSYEFCPVRPLATGVSITDVTVSRNNSSVVINGDTVTVQFTSSASLSLQSIRVRLSGIEGQVTLADGKYTAKFQLPNNAETILTDGQNFAFYLLAENTSGNSVSFEEKGGLMAGANAPRYWAPPALKEGSPVITVSGRKPPEVDGKAVVERGDVVTFEFVFEHAMNYDSGTVLEFNGKEAVQRQGNPSVPGDSFVTIIDGGTKWIVRYRVGDEEYKAEFGYRLKVYDDYYSEPFILENSAACIVGEAIGLDSSYTIEVNGDSDATHVRAGHTIKVSFSVAHEVSLGSSSEIAGVSGSRLQLAKENGGSGDRYYYTVSVEVPANFKQDDSVKVNLVLVDEINNVQSIEKNYKYSMSLAESISDIFISSNNTNNTTENQYAKERDIITVTFKSSQELSAESLKILGQTISGFRSRTLVEGGYTYSFEYRIAANDVAREAGTVTFSFTVKTKAGEEKEFVYDPDKSESVSLESNSLPVVYYPPIEMNGLKIVSDNEKSIHRYAKNGDSITISFTTNREIEFVRQEIAGKTNDITTTSSAAHEYTMSYTLKDGDLGDQEIIPFSFELKDVAGNSREVRHRGGTVAENLINDDLTYYAPINTPTFTLRANNTGSSISPYRAAQGDEIFASFSVSFGKTGSRPRSLNSMDIYIEFGGKAAKLVSESNWRFVYSYSVGDEAWGNLEKIPFSYKITDNAGNEVSETSIVESAGNNIINSIVYYAPMHMRKLVMSYQNPDDRENPNKTIFATGDEILPVRDGFIVIAEVEFNHAVTILPADASKEIPGASIAGIPAIFLNNPLDLNNLTLKSGEAFYYQTSSTEYIFVVYLPNKPSQAATDPKDEDIYHKTNLLDDALIDIAFCIGDGVQPVLVVSDIDAARALKRAGNEFRLLRYYAPLDISSVDVKAGEAVMDFEGYWAVKDGTEIFFTFFTGHEVDEKTIQATVAGNIVLPTSSFSKVHSEQGHAYQVGLKITPAVVAQLNDLDVLHLSLTVQDILGQTIDIASSSASAYTKARYYEPISISEITIESNNIKDGTRYAKDEDTITISFVANHSVQISDAFIAGRLLDVQQQNLRGASVRHRFSYQINNGDLEDLAQILFAFTVGDAAGNVPLSFDSSFSGVKNALTYYEPLEAISSISSNNARLGYAKNGDTITIENKTNHIAGIASASLSGRDVPASAEYVENPVLSFTIPAAERGMFEGEISIGIRLEDPAGNFLYVREINDGREHTVIYDRTAPEIMILPLFSGFINQETKFALLYSDLYLDQATVSCFLNGIETARAPEGTSTNYTHNITLNEDGEYSFTVAVSDMAGNIREYEDISNIILDTVLPIINLLQSRNTFAPGYMLSESISIDELHIQDVVCTVSDMAGVHQWDLDQPMEQEGKKTIHMVVRDMAGNDSLPFAFDIFIDGTAPWVNVLANAGKVELISGKDNIVAAPLGANLSIELMPLHMGDDGPDKFTMLQLYDQSGLVVDFLSEKEALGPYEYTIGAHGQYTLVMEATDEVGNTTGRREYTFEYRNLYILERLLANTPFADAPFVHAVNDVIFSITCVIFVSGVGLIIWRSVVRGKRKRAAMEMKRSAPSDGLMEAASSRLHTTNGLDR